MYLRVGVISPVDVSVDSECVMPATSDVSEIHGRWCCDDSRMEDALGGGHAGVATAESCCCTLLTCMWSGLVVGDSAAPSGLLLIFPKLHVEHRVSISFVIASFESIDPPPM